MTLSLQEKEVEERLLSLEKRVLDLEKTVEQLKSYPYIGGLAYNSCLRVRIKPDGTMTYEV